MQTFSEIFKNLVNQNGPFYSLLSDLAFSENETEVDLHYFHIYVNKVVLSTLRLPTKAASFTTKRVT